MELGVDNAILQGRPLPETFKVIADLGLTSIDVNSARLHPSVHMPTFVNILSFHRPLPYEARVDRIEGLEVVGQILKDADAAMAA